MEDLRGVVAEDVDSDALVRAPRERQWDVTVVVVLGGIVGAEARLGLSEAIPNAKAAFPWSTVCINVIGCLLIGFLMTTLSQLASPHRLVRPFLGIGLLGGFTTFSTFTVDAERLIQEHRAGVALLYVLCTLVAAAVAVAVGTIASQVTGQQVVAARLRRADRSRNPATGKHLTKGRR